MNTFFVADLHIGHKNILIHCPNRKFEYISEMDKEIVIRNNSIVSDSDEVYDLGDFAFRCSPDYAVSVLKQLNGKRYLLLGNHDKPLRQAYRRGLLDGLIKSGKLVIVGNIEDSTVSTIKKINIGKQIIILSHYALRTWPNAFRGKSWLLYGHSHNNLASFYKSMDVGVDTNNLYPWKFEQIKEKMDNVKMDFREKEEVEEAI
jgi:calcineurin-like phosphoesterase family protein